METWSARADEQHSTVTVTGRASVLPSRFRLWYTQDETRRATEPRRPLSEQGRCSGWSSVVSRPSRRRRTSRGKTTTTLLQAPNLRKGTSIHASTHRREPWAIRVRLQRPTVDQGQAHAHPRTHYHSQVSHYHDHYHTPGTAMAREPGNSHSSRRAHRWTRIHSLVRPVGCAAKLPPARGHIQHPTLMHAATRFPSRAWGLHHRPVPALNLFLFVL